MSKTLLSALFVVLAVAGVTLDAVAGGDSIIIQVRTPDIPGVHFDSIRTEFFDTDGSTLIAAADHAAIPGRDYGLGVRVFEFLAPSGFDFDGIYFGRTSLRLAGSIRVERPWRLSLSNHGHDPFPHHPTARIVTILLVIDVVPVGPVSKVATLEEDNDASGTISDGDVLRYTIPFYASHALDSGSVLRDVPDPHSPLIPGSVSTSHGTVIRGNLASSSDVEVRYGFVPLGDTTSVSFLVRVSCVSLDIVNQGTLTLRREGSSFEYDLVTDDPSTAQPDDPTVVLVDCGQGDPLPGPALVEVSPQVNPQYATSGVMIESDGLDTAMGSPTFTMNGASVQTEIFFSVKDQDEIVGVVLTPEMTAKAGVIPFSLTPAGNQLPVVNGFMDIRPALATPKEIGKAFGETASGLIADELAAGMAAFEAARSHAQMDPDSCEALKDELKSDLQFANAVGVAQIIAWGDVAREQAVVASASQQQLDEIDRAIGDEVALLNAMMRELMKNTGKKSKKGSKGKGSRRKSHGLICPD